MATFSVVSHRSSIGVEVRATLQRFALESRALEGTFDAELGEGTLKSLDVTGRFRLPAESLHSGNRLFDRDMRKMLETRKYPEMAGVVLGIEDSGDPRSYRVRGKLSVRGVTREVTGTASIVEAGPSHAVLEGEMRVDIVSFQIDPPKLLVLKVEPELRVFGRVYAERMP